MENPSENMSKTKIKLRSSDMKIIEVNSDIAKCSGVIKTMLEDCGVNTDGNDIVPIRKVRSRILKKIFKWAKHNKNAKEHHGSYAYNRVAISKWEADFLNVDQGTLIELLAAADYLDMQRLMDITAQTIAKSMKDQSVEQIRQQFNIEDDS